MVIVHSQHVLNMWELSLGLLSFTPVEVLEHQWTYWRKERGTREERKCVRVGVEDMCLFVGVCVCEEGLLSDPWAGTLTTGPGMCCYTNRERPSLPCKALVECMRTVREYALRQEGWNL